MKIIGFALKKILIEKKDKKNSGPIKINQDIDIKDLKEELIPEFSKSEVLKLNFQLPLRLIIFLIIPPLRIPLQN